MSEITTEVLQDLVNAYTAKGRAPKTIRNMLSFISIVLKQAMNDNDLRRQDKLHVDMSGFLSYRRKREMPILLNRSDSLCRGQRIRTI